MVSFRETLPRGSPTESCSKKNTTMSKQMVVCHMQKMKGSGGGMGNHVDRVEGKEHSFENADPTRTHLNREMVQDKYKNISLPEAIALRIKEGYNCRTKGGELKKIYTDAIKFVELNLSGSHERMKEIEKNPVLLDAWYKENFEFAKAKYGEENIVRFTLHLDETTPHIHCLFIPLTPDGRLCANDLVKKKDLYELQDNYAEKMHHYGLERGERGSDKVHNNKQVYNGKILRAEEEIENLTVKSIFGVDKDKTIKNLKNALKTNILRTDSVVNAQNKTKNSSEYRISMIHGKYLSEEDSNLKENEKLKADKKYLQNYISKVLDNPDFYYAAKEDRKKRIEEAQRKATEEKIKASQNTTPRKKGRGM